MKKKIFLLRIISCLAAFVIFNTILSSYLFSCKNVFSLLFLKTKSNGTIEIFFQSSISSDSKDESKKSFPSIRSNDTNNSMCDIIKLNEWDKKIKYLFKKNNKPYSKCAKSEPLTFMLTNQLHINQTVNQTFFHGSVQFCDFAPIYRNTSIVDSISYGNFEIFSDSVTIKHEFIKVRCFTIFDKKKYLGKKNISKLLVNNSLIVYEYVHFTIQIRDATRAADIGGEWKNKTNVMILIIDGVSLSAMKRALPNTLRYLRSFSQFYLFEKHHVTGENTFQNLLPMLANLNGDEALYMSSAYQNDSNKPTRSKFHPPFDNVPFIWKNFSDESYKTYFSEEWKESTFYNLKFGFRQAPTSHYLRPYWLGLYDSLSYEPTLLNSNAKPCYFNKLLHQMSFDWLETFEHSYAEESFKLKRQIPTFGIVKVNEMSHDYLDRLFWIDNDLKQLLASLFTIQFLENTLFILMGDHGHRFHKIRQTYVGKTEERLPMFSMMLPKRFSENEMIHQQVTANTKELTTWWDVYETLVHLLIDQDKLINNDVSIYYQNLETIRKDYNKPRGFSLFRHIPLRDCMIANIPSYLCSCERTNDIDINSQEVQSAATFLVNHINNILLMEYRDICTELHLSKIFDAQKLSDNKLSLMFETSPSKATYDATVNIEINDTLVEQSKINSDIFNIRFSLEGKIIRTNQYGLTSKCIDVYNLKNYCFCKKQKRDLPQKKNHLTTI